MSEPVVPHPKTPLEWTIVFVAEGFGTGWARYAPGTWGSALGVGIAWLMWQLPWPFRWFLTLLIVLAGIPLCGTAAKILGTKDPRRVVWDEIAAMQIVFLIAPAELILLVPGFLLFRLFDIWKPWPIERLERLPGGLGIMVDDLAAGVMASAVLVPIAYGVGAW